MIHIKCIFPKVFRFYKPLKVRKDGYRLRSMRNDSVMHIDANEGALEFILGKQRANIQFKKSSNSDRYFNVHLGLKASFPFYFKEMIAGNCLHVNEVSKTEFEAFQIDYYKKQGIQLLQWNMFRLFSTFLGLVLSVWLLGLCLASEFVSNEDFGFLLWMGLGGMISHVFIFYWRKKITKIQFFARTILFTISMFVALYLVRLDFETKVGLDLLVASMFLSGFIGRSKTFN